MRIIRGQVLSVREKEFVLAAESLGAPNRRIIFREVLPNLIAPIIVYSTLVIPLNILFEAALSFLGVGIQPPNASWGADDLRRHGDLRHSVVVHAISRYRAVADRAGVQSPWRRSPRCVEPPYREITRQTEKKTSRTPDERTQMPLQPLKILIAVVASLALGITVAACGSNDNGGGGASSGGNVKILETAGGIDSLDPGYWYYQTDYTNGFQTTQRALYGWKPDETTPTPDVATGSSAGIQRRQDGHDHDQAEHQVQPGAAWPQEPDRQGRPTSSTRWSAASCRRSATATRTPTTTTSTASKDFTAGKAKEISGHHDAGRHDARDQDRPMPNGVVASGAARSACPAPCRCRRNTPSSTTRASSRPTASTRCSPGRT